MVNNPRNNPNSQNFTRNNPSIATSQRLVDVLLQKEFSEYYATHQANTLVTDKQQLYQQFSQHIRNKYNGQVDVLQQMDTLLGSKVLDFQQIASSDFSYEELVQGGNPLNMALSSGLSERDATERAIASAANAIDGLTASLNNVSGDDFIRSIGLTPTNARNRTTITINTTPPARIKHIDDVLQSLKQFLSSNNVDYGNLTQGVRNTLENAASSSQYHPGLKAVMKATINAVEQVIDQFSRDANDLQALKQAFRAAFQRGENQTLTLQSPYQSLTSLTAAIDSFMNTHNFSTEERELVETTSVKNHHIHAVISNVGGLAGEQPVAQDSLLSQWGTKQRRIFNTITQQQLSHSISRLDSIVTTDTETMKQAFSFPTSVNQFFHRYRDVSHQQLQQIVPQNKRDEYENLAREYATADQAYNDPSSPDFRNPSTLQKKVELDIKVKQMHWDFMIEYISQDIGSANGVASYAQANSILKKLQKNKYNAAAMSVQEQNELLVIMIGTHLESIEFNNTAQLFGLDQSSFKQFIYDIFDLTKTATTIPTIQGDLPVKFSKKKLLGKPLRADASFDDFIDTENIPLHCEIDVSDPSVESFFFHTSGFPYSSPDMFFGFEDQGAQKRGAQARENQPIPTQISESYKVTLTSKDGSKTYTGYLSPKGNKDMIQVGNENTPQDQKDDILSKTYFLYTEPVSDQSNSREHVMEDGSPVHFTPDEQKKFHITIQPQDKKLHFNGSDISRLIGRYVLAQKANPSDPQTLQVADQLSQMNDAFRDTNDQYEHNTNEDGDLITPLNGSGDEINATKDALEGQQDPEMLFHRFLDQKIEPRGREALKLQEGLTFMVKNEKHKSDTRPDGGFLWNKFTFVGYGNQGGTKTAQFRLNGIEHPLTQGYEGKTIDIPMTPDGLKRFSMIFGPNIHKINTLKQTFEEVVEQLGQAGMDLDLEHMHKVQIEDKVLKQAGEEVTHFALEQEMIDGTDKGQPIIYKVEHKDGKFELQGNYFQSVLDDNGQPKKDGEGDNAKTVVEEVTQKMVLDYPSFIIFMTERGLKPKTAAQAKNLEAIKNDVGKDQEIKSLKGNSPWVTWKAVKAFFGSTKKSILDQFANYDTKKARELMEFAVGDKRIYSLFGKLVPNFIIDFDAIQNDYDKKLPGQTNELINDMLKLWDAHHSKVIGKRSNPIDRGIVEVVLASESGDLSYYQRIKAAAGLIWMLDKGHGPYGRGMQGFEVGSWVRALMGDSVYQQFTKLYAVEKSKIDGDPANMDFNMDELVKLEMTFILDNIRDGRLSVGGDVASKHLRFFSLNYAGELDGKVDKYYQQAGSAQAKTTERLEKTPFSYINFEMGGIIRQNRANDAVGALKAMAKNAKTPGDYSTLYKFFTMMMMSGMTKSEMFQGSRYGLWALARSSGILLGGWVPQNGQQKKLFETLNFISEGGLQEAFDEYNKKNPDQKPPVSLALMQGTDRARHMGAFCDAFDIFWSKNGKTALDFFTLQNVGQGSTEDLLSLAGKQDMYRGKKIPSAVKPHLKELADALMESAAGSDIDTDVKNNTLINFNPFVTSASIFAEYSVPTQDGISFQSVRGKTNDKHQRTANGLRKAVKKHSQKTFNASFDKIQERDKLVFYMKKFFKIFEKFYGGFESNFARVLSTIKHNPSAKSDKDRIIRFHLKGWLRQRAKNGIPESLENALDAYIPFFTKNIDLFDFSIMQDALGTEANGFKNPWSYTVGYKKYTNAADRGYVINGGESKHRMEHSMAEINRQYGRVASNEDLWDKISFEMGLNDGHSNIFNMKSPTLTKDNIRSIASAKSQVIKKTSAPIIDISHKQVKYRNHVNDLEPVELQKLKALEQTNPDLYDQCVQADGSLTNVAMQCLKQLIGGNYKRGVKLNAA